MQNNFDIDQIVVNDLFGKYSIFIFFVYTGDEQLFIILVYTQTAHTYLFCRRKQNMHSHTIVISNGHK